MRSEIETTFDKSATALRSAGVASLTLTAKQVAQRLSLPISTVYFYAATKKLPAIRIGTKWRFPIAQLDALLRKGGSA